MGISNNRSFFRDTITDGWTKKDWALNLIPLGGIASVAYEIGSACLSSRDRAAKISKDFFKSPIQTTLKKIAQCLWVPTIVCGALKLVCLIVNACWNRCFPRANDKPREESQVIDLRAADQSQVIDLRAADQSQVIDLRAADPCTIIPPEVVVHIFSYLKLHELAAMRMVSKEWHRCANTPILWKEVIYREFAFSSKDWAERDADLVKDVDMRQEMLSLPKNIAEELRRSAIPGKSIRETHVLVRMPKESTIKKFGELGKTYFPRKADGYRDIWSPIVNELGDKAADGSIWLLMTKDFLRLKVNKAKPQGPRFSHARQALRDRRPYT
jgi:hypothetical protein